LSPESEMAKNIKANIDLEPPPQPRMGRTRVEITARYKGKVVFHKAGPANIVLGLYSKWRKSGGFSQAIAEDIKETLKPHAPKRL